MMRAAITMLLAVAACHGPGKTEQPSRSSAAYDDAAMWLCRPDVATDACHGNLDATELLPDGTRKIIPFVRAAGPDAAQVDCFYIYPTVDLDLRSGNHTDFKDRSKIDAVVRAQIARFAEVCNVYAPLYRQITIGTYVFASAAEKQRYSAIAYSDIVAAFHAYLTRFDRGHRIVIIGHSQGAELASRLLHDTFDSNDALRARLLVAMPIGFDANTPDGATVGGSFEHLAACTTDDETGCIVAYRSIAIGDTPGKKTFRLPPGRRAICVNPGGAGASDTPLVSIYPSKDGKDDVTTPYVIARDVYRSRCVRDPDGKDFLEIHESALPGDQRPRKIDIGKFHGGLGLHIFDLTLPQGDLIELIRRKAAAAPPPT